MNFNFTNVLVLVATFALGAICVAANLLMREARAKPQRERSKNKREG